MALIAAQKGSSGGGSYKVGTITPNTSTYTLANCGFAPKQVVLYRAISSSNEAILHADFESNKLYATINNGSFYVQEIDVSTDSRLSVWADCVRINGNDFEFIAINSNNEVVWNYLAAG